MHLRIPRTAGLLGAAALVAGATATAASAGTALTAATGMTAGGGTASTAPSSPLVLHFTQVTTKVTKAGAQFSGPRVTVTGGMGGAAGAVAGAVQRHVSALRTEFAAEAVQAVGVPVSSVFDDVRPSVYRSAHFVTVRLDEGANLGGAHPTTTVHAYVFNAATGREVPVSTLFTHPAVADRLLRAALVVQNRRTGVTAADLATLTLVPRASGSTAPLTCYPARTGLHCAVDQGSILSHAVGPLEATVPWAALVSPV